MESRAKKAFPRPRGRPAKFGRIADDLRRRVLEGALEGRIPGERDLARAYGVHVLTANKAVTSLVRDGLLRRVRGVGTFVTRLRRRRTGTLAAVVGNVRAPLHARIVRGMDSAAHASRQHLIFHNDQGDPARENEFIARLLADEKADGFLVWPAAFDLSTPGMRRLAESGVPYVVFPHVDSAAPEGASSVTSDDCEAARVAVRHLAGLGHERIGFVAAGDGSLDRLHVASRRRGYEEAMAAVGLQCLPTLTLAGRAFARKLARQGVTGVSCTTDNVAIEALRALAEAGIRVPTDVLVVGLDGIPRAADFDLTTVEQPMEEVGRKAVEVLLEEIEGRRSGPVKIALAPRLIVRGSTGRQGNDVPG